MYLIMYKNFTQNDHEPNNQATIEFSPNNVLYLKGIWQWSNIEEEALYKSLDQIVTTLKQNNQQAVTIDGSHIRSLDTAGIYFINKISEQLVLKKIIISSLKLNDSEQILYDRIIKTIHTLKLNLKTTQETNLLTAIGQQVFGSGTAITNLLIFFGQFCINLINWIKHPLSLQWDDTVRTLRDAGIKGLWVVSLLCFLIGVTLAYEMAPQFITYGANVYIVNFLGISLLKEVAPLLTAIIVAGRTGASITAEIGVMKIEEEIDAIQTMGISPIRRLVLPKVLGVVIATPLITAIADVVSLIGGAIVSNSYLNVTYSLFLSRLQTYVSIDNYKCGIIKSVFFGLAIALIGCFCGFNVKGNANSIGEQTTKSVVWGIIAIVLLDSIFAIIFKFLGM
jgi:phospholipid/cholesterol/gamma-HCH transport system permease protein